MDPTGQSTPALSALPVGPATPEVQSSTLLSNSLVIIREFNAQPEIQGKTIMGHIENGISTIPLDVRVRMMEVINRNESGNPSNEFRQNIVLLESYFERRILMSEPERASNVNADLELLFESICNEIKETDRNTPQADPGLMEGITDTVGDFALGSTRTVTRFYDRLPPVMQAGGFLVAGIALFKIGQNYMTKGSWTRLALNGLAVAGIGYYASGQISRAVTGRTVSENLDNWMSSGEREDAIARYGTYFSVNLSDEQEKIRLDLLIETLHEPSAFSNRPFKDVLNAYTASTADRRLPAGSLVGTSFDSIPDGTPSEEAVMFEALDLFYKTLGPGSPAYIKNEEVRIQYEYLMSGGSSFRQGFSDLLSLDPDAPVLPARSTVSATVGSRVSSTIAFARDKIVEIFGTIGGAASTGAGNVKDFIVERYQDIETVLGQNAIANWLNKEISTRDQFGAFEQEVGHGAMQALGASDNLFRDPTGVVYGGYEIPMNEADFGSSIQRMQAIVEYSGTFTDAVTAKYPGVDGDFELLYGAELRTTSGGNYYLAFSFIPEAIDEARMNGRTLPSETFDAARNFDNYRDFRLNANETMVLMEYYQASDYSALIEILNTIRSGHIPTGETALNFANSGRLLDPGLRTTILDTGLDTDRSNFFDQLLTANTTVAAGNAMKKRYLDTYAAMVVQDEAYRTEQAFTSTITDRAAFVTEYTAKINTL